MKHYRSIIQKIKGLAKVLSTMLGDLWGAERYERRTWNNQRT